MDIEELIKKYHDNIVVVDRKKPVTEIIRGLVDIREIPIGTLTPTHLKFSMENVAHYIQDNSDKTINLHLYQVLFNEKSVPYYQDISNDTTYIAYFEKKTVYIIAEDTRGIIETNSSLLFKDVKIARGVTKKQLEDKSLSLIDYLSVFDQE